MSDFFARIAGRAPDTLAGRRGGAEVGHAELMARARAWTALGRRTAAGQVALYHEDSLEFAAALLGAWQSGKTVWLVADTLPASCAALAREFGAGSGADSGAFWGQFPADCRPAAPGDGESCPQAWREPAPDFPALVVYTSGSTGTPVPIRKQLSQLTGELAALEACFGARLGDGEVLATVSHQHIYGLLFRVLWPLAAGRAIHAERHEFPEPLVLALAARPCVLLASPAHLKRLPAHLDWRCATAQLRAVFSSGGMLEAAGSNHARSLLGQAPVEVYGSSETGGVAWRQRGERADEGWTPLPGVAWRLDAEGLLEVHSVHAGPDRWQGLPDRVEALDEGRFLLRGRADRIVKIEEKRVSLDAIEAALLATGLVREARVLACPGLDGARQLLAAFVVPNGAGAALLAREGKPAMNARLRSRLGDCIEAVALPRRWRYLDALPVNAQGKTTQAGLLALLEDTPGDKLKARPRWPALRVLEEAPARMLLELTVPADLLYFDGHFSVAPVLPGVVQVDWAFHYGRRYFGLDAGTGGGISGMAALKFQQMIRPEQPVRLELVHDAAKGSLNFRYFSDAGAHASGRILLGADRTC